MYDTKEMGAIATSNPDASKEVRTQTVGTPMSGVQIANGITQLREQNRGIHAWSHNQQRLYLGLGKNNGSSLLTMLNK